MCGIYGEISRVGATSKDVFDQLLNRSFRRGPDSLGLWRDETCTFGFRRLSILDVTEYGDQPKSSTDGRWILVFNGEIYNYKRMQQTLHLCDADLRSTADSEILIRYVESRGVEEAEEVLNGIYAIALYDQLNRELHLLRDPAGVKPLYYGVSSHGLVFASQFDQIVEHPWFASSLSIDARSFSDHLALGYMPSPNTIYQEIRQVEPGQHMVVKLDGSIRTRRVWRWREQIDIDEKHEASSWTFMQTFDAAVKSQLVSDVPIGAFISGGIDSPLVSASAVKAQPGIQLFTIGVNDPKLDEAREAAQYASSLHAKHEIEYYTPDILRAQIDEHFNAFQEPFGDYSSLPSFQVCKMAKRRFTVALSGDGGDELFWGYPRFLNAVRHHHWFKRNPSLRRALAYGTRKLGKKVSYGIEHRTIGEWILGLQSHNKESDARLFFPEFSYSDTLRELYHTPAYFDSDEELLLWLRRNEFYGHLQRVLVKVDRTSMYHSLEVRVPFLDRTVIEFAQRLKPQLGITHNEPKYLLRRAAEQIYGRDLVTKEKKGFTVPMDHWLRTILREEVQALLIDRDPWPHNSFDRKALAHYVNRFQRGHIGGWGIWILYALQKWADRFAPA